jgi:hypothetical protein
MSPLLDAFLESVHVARENGTLGRYSRSRAATAEEWAPVARWLDSGGKILPVTAPPGLDGSPELTAACVRCGFLNARNVAQCALCRENLPKGGPSRRGTFVTLARTDPRTMPPGTVVLGATVDVFASEPEADGSRWVELAYSVSMADSDVTLAREDFERCIENFKRYPCVPVVIEHADTDWFGDHEQSEPHGYVEELALGEREVTEMNGTKRTATTLRGRVSFDAETAPTVGPKKKWRFGSITMLKGVTDEATGAGLGCLLWSWSLTAHPRLMGLAPIAASLDPSKLTPERAARLRTLLDAFSRGDAARNPTEPLMKTFLEMAAMLGIAATSEEDARTKVLAFLSLSADAFKALGLSPTTPTQEFAAKLSGLTTAAAKVPALEKELTELREFKTKAEGNEQEQYFAELFAVHPELKAAESTLRFRAKHDWSGLQKEHPRPTPQELLQAAQHPQRLAQVVPGTGPANPTPFATPAPEGASNVVVNIVRSHMAMARANGRELTFSAAISEIGAGVPFTG